MSNYKAFGGKTYMIWLKDLTKSEAQEEAKKLRQQNRTARIEKHGNRYWLWYSGMNMHTLRKANKRR